MIESHIRAIVPVCVPCAAERQDTVRATRETGDDPRPLCCYFCGLYCSGYASVQILDPADVYIVRDMFNGVCFLVGIVIGAIAAWN